MGYDLTPEQLEALVNYAAKRLKLSPRELAGTVQQQGLEGLTAHMSREDAAKVKNMQIDHTQAEQLLRSPQAQALLRSLLGGEES